MSQQVLFVAPFFFPNHDAGATRLSMLARGLRMGGCQVELCGLGDEVESDGLRYSSVNPHRHNRLFNWLVWRMFGWLMASYVQKHIVDLDAVVASFLPSRATEIIKRVCKKHNVNFVVDCTEWYTPDEFKRGSSDRSYRDHIRLLTKVIDNSVNVIAISTYLQQYFSEKGCSVFRVPAVLDVNELSQGDQEVPEEDKVLLMYAGSPGKKDSLWMVISALASLSVEEQKHVGLDLYGISKNEVDTMIPVGGQVPSCVNAHGRVSRECVIGALHRCDFTVLMRDPSKRFAQAGMPTKVTESLGSGVPVIANITSDLGEYLVDSENAIIVPEFSVEACANAIRKAISMSPSKRTAMRIKARETAWAGLDYRVYAVDLRRFVVGC